MKPPRASISAHSIFAAFRLVKNIRIATGTIIRPLSLMKRWMELMISELGRLYFLARAVRLLIYVSVPILSTRAVTLPPVTNEPARSGSPSAFLMGTDSPVSSASFTSPAPSSITQSAGICCPEERKITSSRTISSTGISFFLPLRSTFAVGADRMESLSIFTFARISCTMATTMLQVKISTNVN